MRGKAGELRAAVPSDGEARAQDQVVKHKGPTARLELDAALVKPNPERRATCDDGEILMPGATLHRVAGRRDGMIGDMLDDGPALREREPVEAMPHAGAADAHAPIDARYVGTTD